VERSRGARAALAGIGGLEAAEQLAGEPHVLVANELLDNLPFRRLRGTAGGVREVAVDLDGDRFVERLIEPTGPVDGLEPDVEAILPTGALAFVGEAATRLARPGYVLLIDYGAAGEPGGEVHGYRDHRVVADVLEHPGSIDITAGVDLALIAREAERAGLVAFPPVSQRHALRTLGFDRWMRDELGRQARLLGEGAGLEAVRAWSGRGRATLLVDPTGLGRLRWLVLATPGAAPPSWV
jgi:SAM-dependent MidA family methyltransferase